MTGTHDLQETIQGTMGGDHQQVNEDLLQKRNF